ncbi:Homoserine dehydrogenase [Rhodotorula kratochvilovae]
MTRLSRMLKIAVAVIGVGLVGKEVVRQLFAPALQGVFEVVLLSNSRHAVLVETSEEQQSADALLTLLPPSSAPVPSPPPPGVTYASPDFNSVISTLITRSCTPSQHTILIDCTSSASLAALYPHALSSGLSVVTPNKKAFSSSSALYEAILAAQREPGAGTCYHEATCGAGLPVLSTLRDLVATGDEVVRVEGVLSGTLAYLFNQFSTPDGSEEGKTFSEIVRIAKEDGHTEPHPADDLSGADVARKLAILARLASPSSPSASPSSLPPLPALHEGHASIPTQSLIPASLASLADPGEFLAALPAHDAHFAALRDEAAKEGRVLRYVGVLDREKGEVRCGLEAFPLTHPFASNTGSYLSLAIYTRRYAARPLVLQGPGYPLSVTAGAVVADAVRVAERHGCRVGL